MTENNNKEIKEQIKKRENKIRIITIIIASAILICLACLALFLINISMNSKNISNEDFFLVVNITDGDTFTIAAGEQVRLICVDTPEKGEAGYNEAKNFLETTILNKEVRLEQDENASATEDRDKYNRLLRYAYLISNETEIFINKEIIVQGYGKVFPYGNLTSKCDELNQK